MHHQGKCLRKFIDDLDQKAKDIAIVSDLLFQQETGNEVVDYLQIHLMQHVISLRKDIKIAWKRIYCTNDP